LGGAPLAVFRQNAIEVRGLRRHLEGLFAELLDGHGKKFRIVGGTADIEKRV
jgi:hypothetical protein